MHKVDVAILGGGPAGLSAAIGLQKACKKLNVKVFERVTALTPRGAGLRLEVNGVKALEAIDPGLLKAVSESSNNPKTLIQYNDAGEVAFEMPIAQEMEKERVAWGYHHLYVGWSDLQQLLADQLAPNTLQLGAQFHSFHVEDDGVLLEFDGSVPPVKAQVVIGADGYMSRFRRQWLNDEPPEFTNTVMWRGRVPAEKSPIRVDQVATDLRQEMSIAVYPGPKGFVVWNATAHTRVLDAQGVQRRTGPRSDEQSLQARDKDDVPGTELKERAQRVFSIQPQPLRDIIAATDPSVMLEHDISVRLSSRFPTSNRWADGPVTLAGDAAHVVRPTGQGTNQALEDALELARAIAEAGPTEEALRQYEAFRMDRWRLSARLSEAVAAIAFSNKGTLSMEDVSKLTNKQESERLLWGVEMRPLVPSSPARGA